MPKHILQNRLSELLARKERKERRVISRRQMAEEVDVSLSTVQSWATNSVTRFDADMIVAFCEYLNATPGELFALEEINEVGESPEKENALPAAV